MDLPVFSPPKKENNRIGDEEGAIYARALRAAKTDDEREALRKRCTTRQVAVELGLARCDRYYAAFLRCDSMSIERTTCMPPLEQFNLCLRHQARRLNGNCATRWQRYQTAYEGSNPDHPVYLNDLARCMFNVPAPLPLYPDTPEGRALHYKEFDAYRQAVHGDRFLDEKPSS